MTTIRLPLRQNSSTKQIFLWLFGLGVILVIAVLLLVLAPSNKAGSTYDQSPWGSQTFYNYISREPNGYQVKRWQRNYQNLTGTNQVLFQIGDQRQLQNQFLPDEIQTWVEAGNTLIQLTWSGKIISSEATTKIPTPLGQVQVDTRRRVEIETGPNIPNSDDRDDAQVLGDEAGAVLWSSQLEQGKVIYGVFPWFVANIYANTPAANFAYFAQLAQAEGTTIWFDEWLHGYRIKDPSDLPEPVRYGSLWDYLRRTPWLLVLLQAILLGLILLWGKNHRLGPVIKERSPTQANSEQYIQALASVLQKAQHNDFVQSQLSQRLRQELAEKLGLRGAWAGHEQTLSDQELAQAWSERTGKNPQDILLVLGPTPDQLTESELLAWLTRVEQILRGLG